MGKTFIIILGMIHFILFKFTMLLYFMFQRLIYSMLFFHSCQEFNISGVFFYFLALRMWLKIIELYIKFNCFSPNWRIDKSYSSISNLWVLNYIYYFLGHKIFCNMSFKLSMWLEMILWKVLWVVHFVELLFIS